MRIIVSVLMLVCVSACGVQGDLYRPNETPPKRDRKTTPHPYPEKPPAEQEVLPDVI